MCIFWENFLKTYCKSIADLAVLLNQGLGETDRGGAPWFPLKLASDLKSSLIPIMFQDFYGELVPKCRIQLVGEQGSISPTRLSFFRSGSKKKGARHKHKKSTRRFSCQTKTLLKKFLIWKKNSIQI